MGSSIRKLWYTIGDVHRILKISPSKINYWERELGLLHSKRKESKRGLLDERRFSDLDIQRIRTINSLIKVKGFTLVGVARELKEIDFSPLKTLSQ